MTKLSGSTRHRPLFLLYSLLSFETKGKELLMEDQPNGEIGMPDAAWHQKARENVLAADAPATQSFRMTRREKSKTVKYKKDMCCIESDRRETRE